MQPTPAPEPAELFPTSPRAWQARYLASREHTAATPITINLTRRRRRRKPGLSSGRGQETPRPRGE